MQTGKGDDVSTRDSARRVTTLFGAAAASVALVGLGAPAAQAAPAATQVCGYHDYGMYNHCGAGTVMLDVDQANPAYPSYLACVSPGENDLNALKTDDLAVVWAEYLPGHDGCATGTYPDNR
jgi:hypothetical protein